MSHERQSHSLSLDWKFNDFNKVWFKGIFNNRNDWENRYRTTLKDITPEGKADVRVQTKEVRVTNETPVLNANGQWISLWEVKTV